MGHPVPIDHFTKITGHPVPVAHLIIGHPVPVGVCQLYRCSRI